MAESKSATVASPPANVSSLDEFRALATEKFGQHKFTVPNTAITVVTKGLSMGERSKASKGAQKDGEGNGMSFMCWVAHFGLVEPKMTVEELAALPGSVVEPIYDDIMAITLPEHEGKAEESPLAESAKSSPFSL